MRGRGKAQQKEKRNSLNVRCSRIDLLEHCKETLAMWAKEVKKCRKHAFPSILFGFLTHSCVVDIP